MSTLGTTSRGPSLRSSGTGSRSPTVPAITVTPWRGPSCAGTPRVGIGDRDSTELGTDSGPVPRKLQLRRAIWLVSRASPYDGDRSRIGARGWGPVPAVQQDGTVPLTTCHGDRPR